MAPTLAPDGSIIDDGAPSKPFVGPPYLGALGPVIDAGANVKQPSRATPLPAPVPDAPAATYPTTTPPDLGPDTTSVIPKALPFSRLSLTQPSYVQPTSDPASGTFVRPGYGQASTDPVTGLPSAASPNLTKLGKVLTILRGAGMGFAVGSAQPSIGRGFMAGNQFFNQEAQQNQEVQQRAQAMQQAAQNQYVQMHGVHQWIYTRDPDTGDLMQQGVDVMGNPVTKQIPYAPKNPNLKQTMIFDPRDTAGIQSGTPTMPLISAGYDKALNVYRDQGNNVIPYAREFNPAIFNKATPAAGSEAQQALAQAGNKPAADSRVYNGKTYSTPQDAQAAWGQAMQMARIPGVPITAEMAEQQNIPPQFIGYKIKPTDYAAMQRAQNQRYVPIQTGDGEVVVDKQTNTAQLVRLPNGQPTAPVAWAAPREIADPNNPGLTKIVTGGQALGQQGLGSAGFQVPRTIAEREVPTKGGDLRMAFGTMIDHANLLRTAARALHNQDWQTLNSLQNRFQNEFGTPGPITAQAIADAYGGEVSNVINKGHITDRGNEQVAHTLDPTRQNYATIDSVLRGYQALAQSKMNQLDLQEQRAAERVQKRPAGGGGAPTTAPPRGNQPPPQSKYPGFTPG